MNIKKMYAVNAGGENHFFDSKKDALNEVQSAISFDFKPRLFFIKKPSDSHLEKINEMYSSNTFGKVDSPLEKYFLNECLASSDLSICVEITI